MCCSVFFEFCSGSDACAVLLRVWWIPLPEVPPARICILWCSKPGWDLNHGRCCRKSCNAFVVSGLAAGFCLAARFRYFPLPLHLNHGHSCRKSCNTFVVSGLAAGLCLAARFRCFPFPLHLNRWRCLLKSCNRKSLNELR